MAVLLVVSKGCQKPLMWSLGVERWERHQELVYASCVTRKIYLVTLSICMRLDSEGPKYWMNKQMSRCLRVESVYKHSSSSASFNPFNL
jgi:hypothetical protein